MFTNWMEYYISSLIMLGDVDQDGNDLPFTTSLFNESWNGSATEPFGFYVSQEVIDDQPLAPVLDQGTSDPLNRDTDQDGMPDGWEFIFGLSPTNPYDGDEDFDSDGVNFNPDEDDYLDDDGEVDYDRYDEAMEEFYEDIDLGRQPNPGIEDAIEILKIVEKVYKSSGYPRL